MKKIPIDGKIMDVVTLSEYVEHPELYNPKFTAIDCGEHILPLKYKTGDIGPGVYYQQGMSVVSVEKPEDPSNYSASKIIDYDSASSIGEIIENNNIIRDIRKDLVTGPDNVFYLNIGSNDTPEMAALKQAINAKRVDKSDYEDRFTQYQNDMRLLRGQSITLAKLKTIANNFDMRVILTLTDKDDIPNPIGSEIVVDLTEEDS